jgi:heme-degrading monooxygenase HmoA
MIARHWRGLAKPDRASEYEDYLRNETLPGLGSIEGFIGADILRRTLGNAIEFVVVSRWASVDAIAKFAGSDVEAAVVPPHVQSMMIEFDRRATHYECVGSR